MWTAIKRWIYRQRAPAVTIIGFSGLATCFFISWHDWLLVLLLSLQTIIYGLTTGWVGISVGYHRLFTHRSFKTPPGMQFILGVLGIMAFQGPLKEWCITHRLHHSFSDQAGDPHSPVHGFKEGRFAKLRGLWHGHMAWMFTDYKKEDFARWIPDLLKNKVVSFIDYWSTLWVVLSFLFPALTGGVISWSLYGFFWYGVLLGFLSGGLARMFLVQQAIFSVNSFAHVFGRSRFRTGDNSRNNDIVAVVTAAEGYQNNHHAFPWSARLGFTKWETRFDMGWRILKILRWCGLAWDLEEPDLRQIKMREIVMPAV